MSDIQKLRLIGRKAADTKWYKTFCVIYDRGGSQEAGKFLRTHAVFEHLLPYLDFYPGKSGHPLKAVETFTLRFPDEEGKCVVCGNHTKWRFGENSWAPTCSRSCGAIAGEPNRKRTNLRRYGVPNVGQAEVIKNRRRKTIQNKFGVDNAFQSRSLMKKARKSLKRRYGVENPSYSAELKSKRRETSRKNFGTDHWTQNEEHWTKHGVPWNEERLTKAKNTCMDRYGVESPIKIKAVQDKIKKTCLERYGVENPGVLPKYTNYKVYLDTRGVKHVVVGYEHRALKWFDKKPEVIRLESRSKNLPKISYREGDRVRKYYPDFAAFTEETRVLVEVKSEYTITQDLDNIVRKCRAATRFMQKRGWEFRLVLVNGRRKKIKHCTNPTSKEDLLRAFKSCLSEEFVSRHQ